MIIYRKIRKIQIPLKIEQIYDPYNNPPPKPKIIYRRKKIVFDKKQFNKKFNIINQQSVSTLRY